MSKRSTFLVVLGAGMTLSVLACDPPPSTSDAGPAADAACESGQQGCDCLPDGTCVAQGLACLAGTCEEQSCTPGELACACDAQGACADASLECVDAVCQQVACVPGEVGCACLGDRSCATPDLRCTPAGVCVEVSCPAGSEGCACDSGSCGVSADGELLSCDASGTCVSPRCTPGDSACVCAGGYLCKESGDVCTAGYCMPESCDAGTAGCACAGGSCNAELRCQAGRICVDGAGFAGGPCLADGACRRGNRCQNDRCQPCSLGSQACGCTDASTCNSGLECEEGLCVASRGHALGVPTEAPCFTPCRDDYDGALGHRDCSSEGLMDGCLDDFSCVEGQCVRAGDAPRSCQLDVECPDFQACLSGTCQSNCQSSDDCEAGATCVRHVCRLDCDMQTQACPRGEFCSTGDAESGHCMPSLETSPAAASSAPPRTGIVIADAILHFSSGVVSASTTLRNDSLSPRRVTVRKLRHAYIDAQDRPQTVQLHVRDDAPRSAEACVAGTPGCRCRERNGEQICAPLPSGLALSCESDNRCHLPTCDAGELGCVCEGSDCRKVCESSSCPLWWLDLNVRRQGTSLTQGDGVSQSFVIEPGEVVRLDVAGADGFSETQWQGQLEIDDGQRRQQLELRYATLPRGAFAGDVYYFGDFRMDRRGFEAWRDGGHQTDDIAGIKNAFVQGWANFRNGNMSLAKFRALLTATQSESWKNAVLKERCGAGRVCYPYLNADGFEVYTFEPDEEPVPSGVVGLPFVMNIRGVDSQASDAARHYEGRVESSRAMQYGGWPEVRVRFASDPARCSREGEAGCMVFLDSFDVDAVVGGRYLGSTCTERYQAVSIPWLVPGFGPEAGGLGDGDDRRECREKAAPFHVEGSDDEALNASLAAANPMPDGRQRLRRIRLIDGALINSDLLFVIFEESLDPLVGVDPEDATHAYGYMVLKRSDETVADADYVGNPPPTDLAPPPPVPVLSCDPTLLAGIASATGIDVANDIDALSETLLQGKVSRSTSLAVIDESSGDEMVHYLCEETDLFDQGRIDSAGDESAVACPTGSRVIYFTVHRSQISQADIDTHACRAHRHDIEKGCKATLKTWQELGKVVQGRVVEGDPELIWVCTDGNRAYCSDDRKELRAGKTFYQAGQGDQILYLPLRAAISDAFRYRTRFQNRQGSGLGFVPEICSPGADTVPYCYDPDGIAQVRQRIDCLLDLYVNRYADMSTTRRDELRVFLDENFAYAAQRDPVQDITIYHSGFEKLFDELLIMLGDDAYTKALSSRFDLAGLSIGSFEGQRFEPNGIQLSGVAGAEMYELYQATQYYGLALERLFELLPLLQQSLDAGLPTFIGQATVVEYLGRLIRASTQKAKALSEVSKRYQNFNRPDLARLVIERGYTAAYLESMVIADLMRKIGDSSQPEYVAQIVKSISDAQLSYRVALTEMRSRHDAITDEINYFGFAPEYIPFPATEAQVARDNAFEVLTSRAWQRLQIAQQAEDTALQTTRSFDTDAASFQSELIRVENNYEGQLADICGTFVVDGRVYPAIQKYAYLDTRAALVGNPCGLMGTGQVHDAMGAIDLELVDMQRIKTQIANVLQEAEIEEDRIDTACNSVDSFREITVSLRNEQNTYHTLIEGGQLAAQTLDRAFQLAVTYATLSKCMVIAGTSIGGDCGTAAAASAAFTGFAVGNEVAQAAVGALVTAGQEHLRELERDEALISFDMQCNNYGDGLNQIDSRARVRTILLRLKELEVDALRARYETQQALSRVKQLRQQAQRLEAEMVESEQLTINIEAARNNPNVRIYRNDAIINADKTFYAALREVYKATRVYEYYTSQSYQNLEQLFLVRMITRGDYNLQNYLVELEDAFRDFEDQYGTPDLRVTRLSLRDDILRIPSLDVTGAPLSQAERIELFREKLQDPALLDQYGYITVPFSTGLDELSPLTRNHKLRYVQAQIIGSDSGDQSARVYLRMRGTSAVSSVGDDLIYYTFPERTAVINAFFLDQNAFDPSVYRNSRFNDRPYINTRWELVLNQVDEQVNQDINLNGLTDIRLYLYYGDFTVF